MKKQTTSENKIINFKLSKRIIFLINLSYLNLTEGSISDFERELKFYSPRHDLRKVFKQLIENNILKFKNHIINTDFYYLDKEKLVDFILELEELQILFKFYENNHTIVI